MDQTRFLQACRKAMVAPAHGGIGTLGEKTLHAVLKYYFEPSQACHEVPVGPYVADIKGEHGIIEIQTRGFERLRAKLDFFLVENTVTLVYPVPTEKWLIWLDEDGSASPRRKSPKRAAPCEVLPELSKIKPFLPRENLRICVVCLEVEEYRLKNGWSEDGKKGSTRFERMPVALLDEIWLESLEDYKKLLPHTLPDPFTAREFSKAARLSAIKTSFSLAVLRSVKAITQVGKRGKAYLYSQRGNEVD